MEDVFHNDWQLILQKIHHAGTPNDDFSVECLFGEIKPASGRNLF